MGRLLRRANRVGDSGEVPVAALVLDCHGRCIGYGVNRRERDQDPLGHAELVALQQATSIRGDWRCAMGGTIDLSSHESAHHHMRVIGGVLEREASQMLECWFRQRRRRSV
jgi:tRNA(adenine34) deaminase